MVNDDDTEARGFSIDIGKILRDATAAKPRTKPRRSTTASRSTASGDMDDAVRRAVRMELADVKRGLTALAKEVVRLRRSNEDLADKIDRLSKG